jgi:hypothetical protein
MTRGVRRSARFAEHLLVRHHTAVELVDLTALVEDASSA